MTGTNHSHDSWLPINTVHQGDSLELMQRIKPESIALSFWSPPYFVGKSYEESLSYQDWTHLLQGVINHHTRALKPGGFMAINIADILAFADPTMPKFQADLVSNKRSPVTREMVVAAMDAHPDLNRHQLAKLLGCSEQTIQRRLEGNNIRGGKHAIQTRIKPVAGLIDEMAHNAGLYMYDRRIWAKDPAWANSRWHSGSYRAVDEFEYVFILWKPGITRVDRNRLNRNEWSEWGSRGVWNIRSVRSNDDHEAKFPIELAERVIRLLSDPGDIVLDPFMGSGTTGMAAIVHNRNYLGIELLERYAILANENCEKVKRTIAIEKPGLA